MFTLIPLRYCPPPLCCAACPRGENLGVKRDKGESKAEKKARKHAVKAERAARRATKKATTGVFRKEQLAQVTATRRWCTRGRGGCRL